MWLLVLQRMFLEFFLDFLYFPIWWFTGGALRAAKFCARLWQDGNLYLAPGLWLKNLFVPMFGQYDWQGRLMSFFMRLVNIIARGFALLVWTAAVAALFGLWFILPFFIVYMLFRSWP